MIDHVSLGTRDYARAVRFYQEVLAPLGLGLLRDTGAEAAFGTDAHWCFFLYPVDGAAPVVGERMHLAWGATSREHVHAVHAAALRAAGGGIFGPRERPDISPTYFGAMFTDLDGHRIEVKTDAR
ncbi:MAG TPA: VOC family protein [Ramlibacter sp.]|nr:VOC family protein [Ramlibacter sp.]